MKNAVPRALALAVAMLMMTILSGPAGLAEAPGEGPMSLLPADPVPASPPVSRQSPEASLALYYLSDAVVAGNLTFSPVTPDAGTQTVSIDPTLVATPTFVQAFTRATPYSKSTNVSGSWNFRIYADVETGTQGRLSAVVLNSGVQLNTGTISALLTPQGAPTLYTWTDTVPAYVAGGAQIVEPSDELTVEIYYTPSMVQWGVNAYVNATSYSTAGVYGGYVQPADWSADNHQMNDDAYLSVYEEGTLTPAPLLDQMPAEIGYLSNTLTGVNYPKNRTWNPVTDAWNAEEEIPSNTGASVRWVETAYCPLDTRPQERIVAVENANGNVYSYVLNGTTLVLATNHGTASTPANQGFGLAYETASGEALLVWDTNSAVAAEDMAYQRWTGTAWTAVAHYDDAGHAAAALSYTWPVLSSHPSSNQILLGVIDDTDDDAVALVWDGTANAWGNQLDMTATVSNTGTYPCIGVEYESLSGQGLAVTQNAADSGGLYATWSGVAWGAPTAVDWNPSAAGQARYFAMARDPITDNIMVANVDEDLDFSTARWDGAAWQNNIRQDGAVGFATSRNFDVAWSPVGSVCLICYNDATANSFAWRTFPLATTTWSAAATIAIAGSTSQSWITLKTNPQNLAGDTTKVLGAILSTASFDINSITWDGVATTAPVVAPAAITANTVAATYECFDLAFQRSRANGKALSYGANAWFTHTGIPGDTTLTSYDVHVNYATTGSDSESFDLKAWNGATSGWDTLANLPASAIETGAVVPLGDDNMLGAAYNFYVNLTLVATGASPDPVNSSIEVDMLWVHAFQDGASLIVSYDSPAQNSSVRIPEARYFAEDWYEFKWTRGWNLWSMPLLRSENPALGMEDLSFSWFARAHYNDTSVEPTARDNCTFVAWTGAAYVTYVHPFDEGGPNDLIVTPDRGYWVKVEESWNTDETVLFLPAEGIYVEGQYPDEFAATRTVPISSGWNLLGWTSLDSTHLVGTAMVDHFSVAYSVDGIRQPEIACNYTAEGWGEGTHPVMTLYDGNKTYTSFVRIGSMISTGDYDFRLGPGYAFWAYSETGAQTFSYPTS